MLPNLSLEGRVAVITGATGTVGTEVSRTFAAAGADLLLAARRREPLEEHAESLRKATGRKVVTLAADVTRREDLARIIGAAANFPKVDVLVNNAYMTGQSYGKAAIDLEWEQWDIAIRGNIEAPLRLCQAFGRRMLDGDGGAIINMLSNAAFQPLYGFAPYGVTKSALWTMTRYLARECAPKVRINALCPGTTRPGGTTDGLPPEGVAAYDQLMDIVPMHRVGLPEETAAAALFLASDASSYTVGQVLYVDGGRLLASNPA